MYNVCNYNTSVRVCHSLTVVGTSTILRFAANLHWWALTTENRLSWIKSVINKEFVLVWFAPFAQVPVYAHHSLPTTYMLYFRSCCWSSGVWRRKKHKLTFVSKNENKNPTLIIQVHWKRLLGSRRSRLIIPWKFFGCIHPFKFNRKLF